MRTYPVISGLWLNPVGVRLLEVFTLTLTLSLKGEGISELRKSYPERTYPVISGLWLNPVGVRLLEVFTLTLTLSLKGEGISELRKSYPDRSQAVGQDAFTPSAGPVQVQPSGCTGWRLAVALACWRGGQAEETVFHAISCRSNQAKGPGLCPGLVLFPGPGCGLGLRVLLFLAVMGHQGASLSGCMDFVLWQRDGDLRDVIIR